MLLQRIDKLPRIGIQQEALGFKRLLVQYRRLQQLEQLRGRHMQSASLQYCILLQDDDRLSAYRQAIVLAM